MGIRGHASGGWLGGALASAALAGALAGQQPATQGWLGVNLTQNYECVWETNEDWKSCNLVMHVAGLQEGGPASRGGLGLGDQLLAIDGVEVTFQNWTRLLNGIRPGSPVSIDVLRDGARHYVHVVPTQRPADTERLPWVRAVRSSTMPQGPRAFVFTLTNLENREGGSAFAITIRDTDADEVAIEPVAVRIIDGQMRVTSLAADAFVELPDLRRELLGAWERETESSYERATSALDAFSRISARLPSPEFRRRLARIAQVGLQEVDLASGFRRSFAGAEFEPVSRRFAGQAGLLVLRVGSRTPLARLGLQPGDIVYRAGGVECTEVESLVSAVERAGGEPVRIEWLRDGERLEGLLRGN